MTTVDQTRQNIGLSRSRVQHRSHQRPLNNSEECPTVRANTPESWPEPQQSSTSQSSAPTQQFHGVPACTQQVNQPFMQQWYSPDRCVWWAWQPTQWGHTSTTSRTSFTSSSQHPYGGGSNCQHGDNEDANRAKKLRKERAARAKGEPTRLERRAAARAAAATAAATNE